MTNYDKFQDFLNGYNENASLLVNNFEKACNSFTGIEDIKKRIEDIKKRIEEFKENKGAPLIRKTPAKSKSMKRRALTSSSDEEDCTNKSDNTSSSQVEPYLKPKRTASKLATHKINEQTNLKLNVKLRRPKDTDKENQPSYIANGLSIKVEKDIDESKTPLTDTTNELMPPPASKPKRVRKKIKKEVDSDSDVEIVQLKNAVVKLEKIDRQITVKTEQQTRPTRSTRTKQNRQDSDVIIEEPVVSVLVIHDSDNEDEPRTSAKVPSPTKNLTEESAYTNDDEVSDAKQETNKVKRTKKRTKKATTKTRANEKPQRKLSDCSDTDKPDEKEPEKHVESTKPALNSTRTLEVQSGTPETCKNVPEDKEEYMNNCTVVLNKIDETRVLSRASEEDYVVNKTITLSKSNQPQWQEPAAPLPQDNVLTDDETEEEKTPKKKTNKKDDKQTKKPIKTKPMFSPYESSPVKKRVAAFEKLGLTEEVNPNMPARVTRTKTRLAQKEKEKENESEKEKEKEKEKDKEVKLPPVKPKFLTPLFNNKIASLIPQSDGKLYRHQMLGSNSKLNNNTLSNELSVKSATSVKPSRAELLEKREEEQKRRLEKEDEVKRKKEAMLQAKIEEQKRKREEKQLKAQKARENKEREKEEKLRQMLQEKEEKMQEKQLEEMQRKKELQLKKLAEAEEKRKLDEQLKLAAKLREQEAKKKQEELEKKQAKKESEYKPKPLPTDDYEDSDDSTESRPRKPGPLWGQRAQLYPQLMAHRFIPRYFIETLFQMKATTPDLRMMFDDIADYKLKRNSSAIWRTPPRYSQMTKF